MFTNLITLGLDGVDVMVWIGWPSIKWLWISLKEG
jgi:aryl carrier-like protein